MAGFRVKAQGSAAEVAFLGFPCLNDMRILPFITLQKTVLFRQASNYYMKALFISLPLLLAPAIAYAEPTGATDVNAQAISELADVQKSTSRALQSALDYQKKHEAALARLTEQFRKAEERLKSANQKVKSAESSAEARKSDLVQQLQKTESFESRVMQLQENTKQRDSRIGDLENEIKKLQETVKERDTTIAQLTSREQVWEQKMAAYKTHGESVDKALEAQRRAMAALQEAAKTMKGTGASAETEAH